jgi:hypothetical protein
MLFWIRGGLRGRGVFESLMLWIENENLNYEEKKYHKLSNMRL